MATGAAFSLYRHVLIDEGSALIGVALVADKIPIRQLAYLPQPRRPVDVVAITALDQSFIHAMMKGPGKIRFRGGMAAVAKFGLVLHQQVLGFFGVVRGMAIQTTHLAAGVRGLRKMSLLMLFGMTTQTARA
jgi:hypothetical protein